MECGVLIRFLFNNILCENLLTNWNHCANKRVVDFLIGFGSSFLHRQHQQMELVFRIIRIFSSRRREHIHSEVLYSSRANRRDDRRLQMIYQLLSSHHVAADFITSSLRQDIVLVSVSSPSCGEPFGHTHTSSRSSPLHFLRCDVG